MKTALVRCPSERCSEVIEILPAWLGRNMYCPFCGIRMTAKPVEVENELRERQKSVAGGGGAGIRRLPLVALVDNVRSLWNVGSIFRSADACGVRELVLTGISGCPPRPEISKTALGAEQAVAWSYRADPLEALERLRGEGYSAVALETSPQAVPLSEMRWPERICLVVGNEVAGVAQQLLEACELHARIPMYGLKNSFNVAVAFGIAASSAASSLSKVMMYELFEHTSDLGLRVRAPDLDTLFREAAEGLFSMIAEPWRPGDETRTYEFSLRADDHDILLFDWLNELLYTFQTARTLLSDFEIRVADCGLKAKVIGTPLDQSAHQLLHEVKAITYHGLKVESVENGWLAEVIVDI